MSYQAGLDMGPSRFSIFETIKILCEKQQSVSVMEIAEHIPCSRRTIERHLPQLIEAGLVIKPENQQAKKLGFRYTCRKTNNANGC